MEITSSPLALPKLPAPPQQTRGRFNQRLEITPGSKQLVTTHIQSRSLTPTSKHSATLLAPQQRLHTANNALPQPGFNRQQALNTYREIDNTRLQTTHSELLNRIDLRV